MNIRVIPKKTSNFIITSVVPTLAAWIPLMMGYILGSNPHPLNALCAFLGFATSAMMFRGIACEWRDTKLANSALQIALGKMTPKDAGAETVDEEGSDPDAVEKS